MINRLLCKFFGHKRGKRTATAEGVGTFECPRCTSSWMRRDRKPKAA